VFNENYMDLQKDILVEQGLLQANALNEGRTFPVTPSLGLGIPNFESATQNVPG
jgi:hypothetical protein